MKVREADAFVVHPIHLRRLQNGIAGAGKISVALIVGENDNDVGTGWLDFRGVQDGCRCEQAADERGAAKQ